MRTIFYIQPRQSGKTDKAINECLQDPYNTIFVGINNGVRNYIQIKVKEYINFMTCDEFEVTEINNKPKTIILDEYMFFKNKDKIYEKVKLIQPNNLFIISTSDKIYDSTLFTFVKENKNSLSFKDLISNYGSELTKDIEQQLYDLYHNFITDKDTNLIHFTPTINKEKNLSDILSKDKYLIEIENVYKM